MRDMCRGLRLMWLDIVCYKIDVKHYKHYLDAVAGT